MTSDDDLEREVRGILAPLRRRPVAVSSDGEVEAARPAVLSRLAELIEAVPQERAMLARKKRVARRLRYGVAGSLVAAAGTFLWFNVGSGAAPATTSVVARLQLIDGQLSQQGTALSPGVDYAIETLGRLSTPRERGARLVTDEGVALAFDADSTADLDFAGRNRRVALNRGRVRLSVPKLLPGASLSVATPDAVVTVHGTRFSVAIQKGRSCVEVSEGVVSVTRGAQVERLSAGQSSGCEPLRNISDRAGVPLSPGSAQKDLRPEPEIDADSSREVRSLRASRARAPSGTLTQENRLFERVLAAEQAGRWQDAEALARRLLARYPASPMVPDTRRVLARVRAQRTKAAVGGR